MPALRKISDVWKAVDDQRLEAKMTSIEWRQSYIGVCAALAHSGLKLAHPKEEFDQIEVPLEGRGKAYCHRKICVTRAGLVSQPSRISNWLTGYTQLLTNKEREIIITARSDARSLAQPTGVAQNNQREASAVNQLDELIDLDKKLVRVHLLEFRLADIAYCLLTAVISHAVFVADQVKSSTAGANNRVTFHTGRGKVLTVAHMLAILAKNMSLTCIGMDQRGKVDVVWFFCGKAATNGLQAFRTTQEFRPRLYLPNATHPFTKFVNQKQFRFEVSQNRKECNRLLQSKIDFAHTGHKQTLQFLNEDKLQIPGSGHWIEQRAFNMVREACSRTGATAVRLLDDSYGKVDFHLNPESFDCRIQDKVAGKQLFCLRHPGGHPCHPDAVDVLQITQIEQKAVYAIPFRELKDGLIISYFTEHELMCTCTRLTKQWIADHAKFRHDLSTEAGVRSYVAACEAAAGVPPLTDTTFYSKLLADNQHKFGSKKQRAKKAAAKKLLEEEATELQPEENRDSDISASSSDSE